MIPVHGMLVQETRYLRCAMCWCLGYVLVPISSCSTAFHDLP
jgi:hypothetical protein